MPTLVVVHPEGADVSLQHTLCTAIQERITEKKSVYVLPYGLDVNKYDHPFLYSRHNDVTTVESYYSFNLHQVILYEGRKYKGTSCFAPQFLALKKRLLVDNQKEVDLCGVARDVCVDEVYRLLTTLRSKPWVNYAAAAEYLVIEQKTLQHICNTYIPCRILNALCDEPLSSQSDVLL